MHKQELRALSVGCAECSQDMPVSRTQLVGLLLGPAKVCILHRHNFVVGV